MRIEGTILKGVGGVYEVQTQEGVVQCTLRGRLRLTGERVLVGDRVEVSLTEEGQGVVEEILPRKNELLRPAIANVDQVVVVFAVQSPRPNFLLLDRILVQAELLKLSSVVVFTKLDLDPEEATRLKELYSSIPYHTILTSTVTGAGLEEVQEVLRGKISTLAGPSGAGKSSLLNALNPGLKLQTGEVSAKIKRGRHTTRTVELLEFGTGYVADTPGFSQLSLEPDQEAELQFAFPEFDRFRDSCHFRGCFHRQEPGCAVREAVEQELIWPQRYEHYLLLLEEAAPRY